MVRREILRQGCFFLHETKAVYFTLNIPLSFLEILQRVAFQTCAPQVFDRVADTKVKVLGNLNTLHAGRVRVVMRWMIYLVVHFFVFLAICMHLSEQVLRKPIPVRIGANG